MRRAGLAFLLFTGLLKSTWSQDINYQKLFGDDWKKATAFENENRNWIEPLLVDNHISYPLAISIIFPELVRYSALSDKMEITLLKTLYVNLGEDYANFSIGQFQMKPSFAEIIRDKAPAFMGPKPAITFKNKSDYDNIREYRKSIIKDLEDPKTQIYYLIAFIKISEKSFKISMKDELFRVKFLATTYNYGIAGKPIEIEKMLDRKFFNTKLFKTENYSYADVSLFWYKQYITSGQ